MKSKIGAEVTKEQEAYGVTPPDPTAPPQYTTVVIPRQEEQPDHSGAACWYVFGILATIFCCLPCGVIGMVHAMISKHEGEKGNLTGHKRRLRQAKCWTSWSIALGLLFLILLFVWGGLYMRHQKRNEMKKHGENEEKGEELFDFGRDEKMDGKDKKFDGGKDGGKDIWKHGDGEKGGDSTKPPGHGPSRGSGLGPGGKHPPVSRSPHSPKPMPSHPPPHSPKPMPSHPPPYSPKPMP